MPYIIDGHNLIGFLPDISLRDINDEQLLISMLDKYFKHIRKKAIVFFDQGSLMSFNQFKSAFVEVKFIRPPKTADEAIINKLKSLKGNAKNYKVVSSDNWVSTNSLRAGANVISSEIFGKMMIKINQTDHKNINSSINNIDYWLNRFESDS